MAHKESLSVETDDWKLFLSAQERRRVNELERALRPLREEILKIKAERYLIRNRACMRIRSIYKSMFGGIPP